MKCSFGIPYIGNVEFKSVGVQWYLDAWFLLFAFHVRVCYGLGRSIKSHMLKWYVDLQMCSRKVFFLFAIGFPQLRFLRWKYNKIRKKSGSMIGKYMLVGKISYRRTWNCITGFSIRVIPSPRFTDVLLKLTHLLKSRWECEESVKECVKELKK